MHVDPLGERSSRSRALNSVAIIFALGVVVAPSAAQNRGVYPLGMSATGSGVTPAAGFTYVNSFLFYGRDESIGPNGERLATGRNSVLMDMNSFVWVSNSTIGFLGGPVFSASATLPIANNSLSSDTQGSISGGGGFADSYYQPVILGWRKKRADLRAIYGFLAPTGRYDATASDNVGSGYWTNVVASGQTFYLTEDRRTALSAFQMYEWHTAQEGTKIHPGQNFDLDYSLMQTFPIQQDLNLQLGVIGYAAWQTTNKTGPSITPAQAAARYRVNSLGFASNFILPSRKTSLGFKYFNEFSNRSTFQGGSVQISGAVTF